MVGLVMEVEERGGSWLVKLSIFQWAYWAHLWATLLKNYQY